MNDLFEKNIQALEEHHPTTYQQHEKIIEAVRKNQKTFGTKTYEWVKTPNGHINFVYSDTDKNIKTFYHQEDPIEEMRQIVNRADLSYPQVVCFFGVGAGYMPHRFFEHRPKENQLAIIIEKDPVIFFRSLCLFDFTKSFEDETVRWIISDDLNTVQFHLSTCLQEYTTVNRFLKILAVPIATQIDYGFYKKVSELLVNQRDYTTILAGNSVEDSHLGYVNTLENSLFAIENQGLMPWMDKFKGKTCVCVAAGPSLNAHWDTLKKIQGKVPIIAVDTVIKPMIDRGIAPDFVTAIERSPIVTGFFRGLPIDKRTSLVGPILLLRETFDAFHGNHILFTPMHGYSEALGLNIIQPFASGSSVGNLNANLAAHMGFENIIFVGQNLAYGFGTQETHVAGTVDKSREKSRTLEEMQKESNALQQVETQDGMDKVWTRLEWIQFKNQMEQRIEEFSDRNWINTAAKGAKIEGATYMSLEEALKTYVHEDFDIYPYQKDFCQPVESDLKENRVQHLYARTENALDCLDQWIPRNEKLLQMITDWDKQISSLEKQNKNPKIKFLDRCIDKVLKHKIKAVNDDSMFYLLFISVILPAHLAFERSLNEMPGTYTNELKLKRDFLLRHKSYFSLWKRWMPKLREPLLNLKKELKECYAEELAADTNTSSETSVESVDSQL